MVIQTINIPLVFILKLTSNLIQNKNTNTRVYIPSLWKVTDLKFSQVGKIRIKHEYTTKEEGKEMEIPKIRVLEFAAYLIPCDMWNIGFRFHGKVIRKVDFD